MLFGCWLLPSNCPKWFAAGLSLLCVVSGLVSSCSEIVVLAHCVEDAAFNEFVVFVFNYEMSYLLLLL